MNCAEFLQPEVGSNQNPTNDRTLSVSIDEKETEYDSQLGF
jgi:hypothetical protein